MNSYHSETGYLQLLTDTLKNGEKKDTRNGVVYSTFATSINFTNIGQQFPLLTTKKMFIKGIVEELLWFLKGSTDARELQAKGVHIWDINSSREFLDSIGLYQYAEGELGPVYGWQWRKFGKPYYDILNGHKGIDQLKYILEELQKPQNSRRAVLTAWNPLQLAEMALPPCHMIYTFYKDKNGLSCLMNMRSSDLFLGLPFNIASTALLTCIIAKVLHMQPYSISIVSADAHIYEEHYDAVRTQLNNEVLSLPILEITRLPPSMYSNTDEKINWIESLQLDDFKILEYKSANSIKAPIK